jgi:hypothetical protein
MRYQNKFNLSVRSPHPLCRLLGAGLPHSADTRWIPVSMRRSSWPASPLLPGYRSSGCNTGQTGIACSDFRGMCSSGHRRMYRFPRTKHSIRRALLSTGCPRFKSRPMDGENPGPIVTCSPLEIIPLLSCFVELLIK